MDIQQTAQHNIAAELTNTAFFNHVRDKLFSSSLNQNQVDGLNLLVLASVEQGLSLPQIAYVLATAYHETGIVKKMPNGNRVLVRTMQPVEESGKGANYDYGKWQINSLGVKYCFKDSSRSSVYTQDECPHLFYGRGFVQLTWWNNYAKAGAKVGADLVAQPELAQQPETAAKIIACGMAEGWFTGKRLADYITDSRCDYVAARRIVNGTDKAEVIASYARVFEVALNAV